MRLFYQTCLEELSALINQGLGRWEKFFKFLFMRWEKILCKELLHDQEITKSSQKNKQQQSTFHVQKERINNINNQNSMITRIKKEIGGAISKEFISRLKTNSRIFSKWKSAMVTKEMVLIICSPML